MARGERLRPHTYPALLLILSWERGVSGWIAGACSARVCGLAPHANRRRGAWTDVRRRRHREWLGRRAGRSASTYSTVGTQLAVSRADTNEGQQPAATEGSDGQGQRGGSPVDDADIPIFYIQGLESEGGVDLVGDKRAEQDTRSTTSSAQKIDATARQAYHSGNAGKGGGDGLDEVDDIPLWDKIQRALGLGFWSYAGLGLALAIIFLNNVLGLGWLSRALNPDFDAGGIVNVEPQLQIMPLDGPSNLLPP